MNELHEILRPLVEKVRSGAKVIEVAELWGGARALCLLGVFRECGRHLLVVAANEEEAEALADDIRFFAAAVDAEGSRPEVLLFPPWSVLPFEADSPDSGTVGQRMQVLYRLMTAGPCIVVAPAAAVMQMLPPWDLFADAVRTLDRGGTADPDALAEALVAMGYEHAATVTRVGEFSRRGGIIDLFSPEHPNPLRIEFFGDRIESLREFDPETQRSSAEMRQAVALPVRELIVTGEGRERLMARLLRAADGPGEKDRQAAAQLREGGFPPGAEFFAPFAYDMEAFARYLPDGSVVAFVEPDDCRKAVDELLQKAVDGREEEVREGRTMPEASSLYLNSAGLDASFSACTRMHLSLLGAAGSLRMDTRTAMTLGVRLTAAAAAKQPERSGEGTVAGLAEKIKSWRAASRVILVCGTGEAAKRLQGLLREHGLFSAAGTRFPAEENGPWPATVLTGRLSSGFFWPELRLIVITDEEIFGRKVHRPRAARSKAAPFLSTFKELQPGDFIVHTDYGVGEYQGLMHLAVDGFGTDYLTLRYEPDAKLYVPLYSLDKVQKYIGAEGAPPKVDKLGAPTWARTKERVKKDILLMAQELIGIYAAREAMHRAPLAPPDNLYREFEAAFPFEETPDQQKAIEDVLGDMQRPRPMDRLVCGDVGFGKTEVALRAAFKAVEDGYQAAVLVPTTLLADQHVRNFSERLAPFSVRVDALSRFRTRAEQKATLQGLKSGNVDIVIGTHRLLQKDVAFRNLGLLVIDEEQRFGVKHKERIKDLRRMVDVLTLTATPIPRTLHLSLSGIRDLSIIQTPPLDRQAIHVVLARFGKRVIREAVQQELGRGGQVFFVQNRVAGIERMAAYIQNLVPEARIGVAHGQMKEGEIEEAMAAFVAGRVNVLVTTTIIESGIDIPNANTIIINRADRFGLADLYQIKGRVGRSRQKAYAYLLTPEEETLPERARTRLRAIQELSELGAGFRIAAQDLESRGAGNLLGRQQSGHIAAVGIDLYTQMMEEAMAQLRGEEVAAEPDTQITVRASAFIPEAYIGDMGLRLAAYKEISAVGSDEELERIASDLRDRYGALPEPAQNLLEIMKLKLLARRYLVSRIDGGPDSVSLTFAENASVSPDRVMALIKRNKGTISLVPERTIRIRLTDNSLASLSAAAKKCLQELG
jgi:transcription-repair coupling factor (superfamily II helicase)